jgi:Holliday junction resolvase RusA-like endonuclease
MKIFAIDYQETREDFILGPRHMDGQFRTPAASAKEAMVAFRQAQKDGGIQRGASVFLGIHEEEENEPMTIMDFFIDPQSWQRAGTSSGHFYTQSETRAFEDELKVRMRELWDRDPITTGCTVFLTLYIATPNKKKWGTYKTTRPDNDNYEKAIFDAGNGIVWNDDALIHTNTTEKVWDEQGRIRIGVSVDK